MPCRSRSTNRILYGDDSRGEYIYKFVSTAVWDTKDINGGYAAGDKYMNSGKLYVAKFNNDGSGQWIELAYGKMV